MTVFRCFVEKKPAYAVESKSILNDLHVALRNQNVEAVRVLNRYDLENVDEEDYIAAKYTILSEPQVDFFMKKHLHQIMMNIFLRQNICLDSSISVQTLVHSVFNSVP